MKPLTATLAALALSASAPAMADAPAAPEVTLTAASGKSKSPLLAAGLNFFVPGAGYLYNNKKPVYVSLPLIAGAAGLTYIEQFHQFENGTLLEQDPTAFAVMFGAVFVVNTGLAVDAWREAKALNGASASARKRERGLDLALSPAAYAGDEGPMYGASLGVRY